MDISAPLLSYGLGVQQYHWSCPSSDSEFCNVSSPETVSPSYSCMDFSPSSSSLPRSSSSTGPRSSTHTGGTKASVSPSSSDEGGRAGSGVRPVRKSRSKNPSKQRESASEKEKLRMRDLTKALHHLRTYLPPSVAPAGQTLTKIETLRLTIRYISHLSAQLGLSKDNTLCQKREIDISNVSEHQASSQGSPCQLNMSSGCWRDMVGVGAEIHAGQQQTLHRHTPTYPLQNARMDSYPLSCEMEVCAYDDSFNSSMESLLESPEYSAEACQVYNHKNVHYQNMTQEF